MRIVYNIGIHVTATKPGDVKMCASVPILAPRIRFKVKSKLLIDHINLWAIFAMKINSINFFQDSEN